MHPLPTQLQQPVCDVSQMTMYIWFFFRRATAGEQRLRGVLCDYGRKGTLPLSRSLARVLGSGGNIENTPASLHPSQANQGEESVAFLKGVRVSSVPHHRRRASALQCVAAVSGARERGCRVSKWSL